MKTLLWAVAVILATSAGVRGDEKSSTDATAPRRMDVKTVLPSLYEVGSRLENPDAKGEFRKSKNLPRALTENDTIGEPGKVSLVVDLDEPMVDHGYEGFRLRIINRTAERATFPAIDSCLYLVQEARNAKGEWLPLQRMTPATGPKDCAVGWHRVALEPGEYWNVAAPRFHGPFKAKLRFRLSKSRGDGQSVYSSEFDGTINPEQIGDRPGAKGRGPL